MKLFHREAAEDLLKEYMPQLWEFQGTTFYITEALYNQIMAICDVLGNVLVFFNGYNQFVISPELNSDTVLRKMFNGNKSVVWC